MKDKLLHDGVGLLEGYSTTAGLEHTCNKKKRPQPASDLQVAFMQLATFESLKKRYSGDVR